MSLFDRARNSGFERSGRVVRFFTGAAHDIEIHPSVYDITHPRRVEPFGARFAGDITEATAVAGAFNCERFSPRFWESRRGLVESHDRHSVVETGDFGRSFGDAIDSSRIDTVENMDCLISKHDRSALISRRSGAIA
jgi:hypothetical protein